jgi:hypothetical protein
MASGSVGSITDSALFLLPVAHPARNNDKAKSKMRTLRQMRIIGSTKP